MTTGLKVFWAVLIFGLIAGLIALATVGIPSPAVDVRKKIDIETLLR